MSKRGCLVPRQLPRVKRVQVRQAAEEEEEAARHDSDMSVDSYPLELMNVIKWQKIYFFINLDIYEVWMAKFLDILAAPLLHGMLNV